MAESFKSKRVIFKKGAQKSFILKIGKELDLNWISIAEILGVSPRTLADWKRERFSISLEALEILCRKADCEMPKNIQIKDPFWYVKKGARKGGMAKYEKYGFVGDPEKRKKGWQEWWEKEGGEKAGSITTPATFRSPKFSKDLAEFVGIMLGDGGLTKNQIKITLHSKDDLEYAIFVENLLKKLFDVAPGKYFRQSCLALDIAISRVNLVKLCVEKFGLELGNKIKQQVDIPDWIMKDNKFKIACIRGLIDTDGCIIIHKYRSRGKEYVYEKIGFTSRSLPLLNSVNNILNDMGIKNRISGKYDIRIEAKKDVKAYFEAIGTNNPKHLKKIRLSV